LFESFIAHTIAINLQLSPDLQLIMADANQIRQVLVNLVTNSAEAIGERAGSITIRTLTHIAARMPLNGAPAPAVPAGSQVALEVVDTGDGMDAATQARIFEPFFTTKLTGRGLGLAAALGIVRGHGGTIDVQSVVGRGTTITIRFPALAPAASGPCEAGTARAAAQGAPADAAPEPQPAVLVVDDVETVRRLMARILERAGYRVLQASDGLGGIEAFRAAPRQIDCVLLDLVLPDIGGGQVVAAIREIRPDVPIVVMSGHASEEAAALLLGQSVASIVQKPFQPAELREAISRALAR
jgi:CheY-like chemotaxis protein